MAKRRVLPTLHHLADRHVMMLCALLPWLVNLRIVQQLKGILRRWCSRGLLAHFDEFGQYVIAFGAVPSELVVRVPLEYVSTSVNQVSNDLKMTAVGCQVQGGPIINTANCVQVEWLQFERRTYILVHFDYSLDALFLVLPDCSVQRSPFISVFLVDVGPRAH